MRVACHLGIVRCSTVADQPGERRAAEFAFRDRPRQRDNRQMARVGADRLVAFDGRMFIASGSTVRAAYRASSSAQEPIGVGGGVVLAASNEAKAFGVASACRDGRCAPSATHLG